MYYCSVKDLNMCHSYLKLPRYDLRLYFWSRIFPISYRRFYWCQVDVSTYLMFLWLSSCSLHQSVKVTYSTDLLLRVAQWPAAVDVTAGAV